eukprot:5097171-Pyramimonas_sp.AAC.1
MATADVLPQHRRPRAPRLVLEVLVAQRDHSKFRALWCGTSTSTSSHGSDPYVLVVTGAIDGRRHTRDPVVIGA